MQLLWYDYFNVAYNFLMVCSGKLRTVVKHTPSHDLIVKGTASDLELWKWVVPTEATRRI